MSSLANLISNARDSLTRLFNRPGQRERSIENIDENATGMASVAQSESDAEDRAAGAPAEEGGEG